jgi:hypothetical protein
MPDITHMIRIAAPAAQIVPLVSTGPGFTQWWAEDEESGSDGTVRLGFFNRSTIYIVRPEGAPTAAHAAWRCESGDEWSGTRLVFDLQPAGNNETALKFAHAGWRNATDYFVSCNTTWGELMYRLKAAAEGKSPGPLFARNGLAY